jgi:hypothetical protein
MRVELIFGDPFGEPLLEGHLDVEFPQDGYVLPFFYHPIAQDPGISWIVAAVVFEEFPCHLPLIISGLAACFQLLYFREPVARRAEGESRPFQYLSKKPVHWCRLVFLRVSAFVLSQEGTRNHNVHFTQ